MRDRHLKFHEDRDNLDRARGTFKASALLCLAAFLWDDWTAPLMTFVSIATGPARTR